MRLKPISAAAPRRKVNNAAMAKGSPVINSDHHLLASMNIGNAHSGTKGKRPMSCRHSILIKYLAAGTLATMKARAIPGRHASVGRRHQTDPGPQVQACPQFLSVEPHFPAADAGGLRPVTHLLPGLQVVPASMVWGLKATKS